MVERLRGAATRFPTFMSTGAAGDVDLTQRAYAASGAELRGLGFTVDFAPDADVTSGPGDPTIGSRAASSYPSTVAEHVVAAANGFAASGVLPVIKHFPGHGSVPADSHLTLPVQTKSREELEAIYLQEQGLDPHEPTVAYCRIGERSSHTWFVLTHLLGFDDVRNYDGSWTEWGNSVRVPVEQGAPK